MHVFDGEITGPDTGRGATGAQIDTDRYVLREHFLMYLAFIEGMLAAVTAHGGTCN